MSIHETVSVSDSRVSSPGDLRVAHVIGHLSVGGAERHFVTLLNGLAATDKWAVFLSAKDDSSGLYGQLRAGTRQIRVPLRKRTAPLGVFRLWRFFRESRVDVVHTHMFWSSLYASLAARLAGVPVVVTTEHGENKWKKASHRWLERHVISRCTGKRFCVSANILQLRNEVDGVPRDILEVTSNGTEIPNVPASPDTRGVLTIGTVGRLVTQKNYPLFVDTIAELQRRGRDVRGCIVGGGPCDTEIRDYVRLKGLDRVVEMPGMTDNVGEWYRKFDTYLISSSEEGQPIALLEAMAYGLPIVTTDVGAVSRTISNGKEGLVVPPGEYRALADAVCRYIDDPEFAMSCAAAARSRAIRDFSIEAIADQYQRAYVDLLARVQPVRVSKEAQNA